MSEELTLEKAIHEVDCGVTTNPDAYHNEQERLRIVKSIDMVIEAARAHLSRPVVGDEQMREALGKARGYVSDNDPQFTIDAIWNGSISTMHVAKDTLCLSRALLTMSEQLAAEPNLDDADLISAFSIAKRTVREGDEDIAKNILAEAVMTLTCKVEELQPYKDAYDEGYTGFVSPLPGNDKPPHGVWAKRATDKDRPVRVCKVIKLVEGMGDGICGSLP